MAKEQSLKAIFVAYNQAYNEEVLQELENLGQRGFTKWEGIYGRGSSDGEPHMGSHAWPIENHAILAVVDGDKVDDMMKALHDLDEKYKDLGLRAYYWNIKGSI